MDVSKIRSSVIAVVLISVFVFTSFPQTAHGVSQRTPMVFVYSHDYGSPIINDTSLIQGQTFKAQVNVTNAPVTGWNAFEFALYYDQNYLNLTSYDLATNTVFSSTYVSPSSFDGPGALRLSVVCLSCASQLPPSNGTLVNLLFTVKGTGVSPLTLAAGMTEHGNSAGAPLGECLQCPSGSPSWTRLLNGNTLIGVNTKDGYFTNTGALGPIASFTFSPTNPAQGQAITFNATSSFDPDNSGAQNHGILEYLWDFGTVTNSGNETTFSRTIIHTFSATGQNSSVLSGNYSIRLTVIDSDNGFQGMTTELLSITRPPSHCIQVSAIFLKSQVTPGTTEEVRVQLTNGGTYFENFNLSLNYGPPSASLPPLVNSSLAPTKVATYSFNITTSNLSPAVYLLTATVNLYGNKTMPMLSDCTAGTFTTPFQVVVTGLGSAAIVIIEAIVVFVAIIAAVAFLLRLRRKPEPP